MPYNDRVPCIPILKLSGNLHGFWQIYKFILLLSCYINITVSLYVSNNRHLSVTEKLIQHVTKLDI